VHLPLAVAPTPASPSMFHLSPRFWLDDELLEIVEPEAFDLAPEPSVPSLFLVPFEDDDHDDAHSGVRNAAPAPSHVRMRRRYPGIEFRVRLPSTPEETFATFDAATSYAVDQSARTMWRATIDVVARTRAAARWWLGDAGAAFFDEYPDGRGAVETFTVDAKNLGPTP
jgi:hypothetical protein